jgi:uncharacterized protein (DUF302 family)
VSDAIGIWTTTRLTVDEARERLPALLKAEGFGVISEIDLQQAFREKLGEETPPYRIVGACAPRIALGALQHNPQVGLLLPCNLVIRSAPDGSTHVGAIDPAETLAARDPSMAPVAETVRAHLARVIAAIGAA